MYLTKEDLAELTDAKRRSKQAQALSFMGIRFTRTPAGNLKVLQTEVDRVMLGGPAAKKEQPDFKQANG